MPGVTCPPRDPDETLVAEVLGELLGLSQVSSQASFFTLGCDSIRAVQAAARLGERFGRDVPVELLYEHPTVRELAAVIGGERETVTVPRETRDAVAVAARGRRGRVRSESSCWVAKRLAAG